MSMVHKLTINVPIKTYIFNIISTMKQNDLCRHPCTCILGSRDVNTHKRLGQYHIEAISAKISLLRDSFIHHFDKYLQVGPLIPTMPHFLFI